MEKYDVIIIGAGAAGLMCAIEAGKRGRKVLILDKANKVGKKILISGGGRCNFTNMYTSPENYLSQNPHFCKSALSRYTPWDFIALIEKYGQSWTEKSLGQLFCDQKAGAIVNLLVQESQSAGVEIRLNTSILSLSKTEHGFSLKTKEQSYQTDSLVIATGGPSIPAMGATDFVLDIAKQCVHTPKVEDMEDHPEVSNKINIITPMVSLSGIASNSYKNSSQTFIGMGMNASNQEKMQLWDGFNLGNIEVDNTINAIKNNNALIGEGLAINLDLFYSY